MGRVLLYGDIDLSIWDTLPTPSKHLLLRPRPSTQLMRSASLSGYEDLVRSLGREPRLFLRSVGLNQSALRDPQALIARDAARELLEITARATQCEDFALRLAAQRRLSALGPISLVLKEEPTPGQALQTLCRYLRLVNPSLMLHVEQAGAWVILREELLPSPGLLMRQSVELAVASLYRLLSELAGPQWQAHEVCFSHRPPQDLRAHRAFFGRGVKFNQDFNGLVCRAEDLAQARPAGDRQAAGFARKYLDAALRAQHTSVQDNIYPLILAALPSGAFTATSVARLCGIDRRTLHRQLQAEGWSFSRLLDQVRLDLVHKHLRESDLALSDMATLLGFGRQSSFSHWCKVHLGCSATQWRRQALTKPAPALTLDNSAQKTRRA